MLKDTSVGTYTSCLCSNHELLLTKRENLASYDTGNSNPSDNSHDNAEHVDTGCGAGLVIVHDGTKDQVKRHCRDTVNNVYNSHEDVVYPSAKETCNTTDDHSDEHFNEDNYKSNKK